MKRLYDSQKWRKARKRFLKQNPLCVYCQRSGRTSAATIVDHIVPHKNNKKLFWNEKNWQALCKNCHDSVKAMEESRGIATGCGLDGTPLDPKHPWNIG